MKRLKLFAGAALVSIAAVAGIGQSSQAAPRWILHGYATSRVGGSSFGATTIETQTTKEPTALRFRNTGSAAVYLDFATTCYQYQRGQPYQYAVAKSLFNMPVRAKTGTVNIWPANRPGTIRPYKYCTVSARARPQHNRPGILQIVIEGH
jgi:hypothetical protein